MDFSEIVENILESKKYRDLGVSEDLAKNVLKHELAAKKKTKEGIKSAKTKLHNIIADYLGDPDYAAEIAKLKAFKEFPADKQKEYCSELLKAHVSTKERLEILPGFYREIFAVTGKPRTICDLACGLNPLTCPWMELDEKPEYFAYDIREDRVNFINAFFKAAGLLELAFARDIAVDIPEEHSDVCFLLKEIHRMEQRKKGLTLEMLKKINADFIVVSLPTGNMNKTRDLSKSYKNMFYKIVKSEDWEIKELHFSNEMVFVITKNPGP